MYFYDSSPSRHLPEIRWGCVWRDIHLQHSRFFWGPEGGQHSLPALLVIFATTLLLWNNWLWPIPLPIKGFLKDFDVFILLIIILCVAYIYISIVVLSIRNFYSSSFLFVTVGFFIVFLSSLILSLVFVLLHHDCSKYGILISI